MKTNIKKKIDKVKTQLGVHHNKDGTTTIEMYPKFKKPDWVKVGVICTVRGEGNEAYIIHSIGDRAAFMCSLKDDGNGNPIENCGHGWESYSKLEQLTGIKLERRKYYGTI